jgi:hypothetical protein
VSSVEGPAIRGCFSCAGNRGVRRSFQLIALQIQQLAVVLNSARDCLAVCTRRIALGHILYVYMLGTPLEFNAHKTCCLNIYLMILMYEIVTKEMFVIKKYCRMLRFVISPKYMGRNYFTIYSRCSGL